MNPPPYVYRSSSVTRRRIDAQENRLSGLEAMVQRLIDKIDTARPSTPAERFPATSIEDRLSRIEAMLQSLLERPIASARPGGHQRDDEELAGCILINGTQLRELTGLGKNRFYAMVKAGRFDHLRAVNFSTATHTRYVRDAAVGVRTAGAPIAASSLPQGH